MAVRHQQIAAQSLAEAPGQRLDVRYYEWLAKAAPLDGLLNPIPMSDILKSLTNGSNLPVSTYDLTGGEPEALYVSVAGVSQYVLEPESCSPIRANALAGQSSMSLSDQPEVLLTRSGVTGVAWPHEGRETDVPLVPSGFLIRGVPHPDVPVQFVAAIVNHPYWRALTHALSAGKSQDNISQEMLWKLPFPDLTSENRQRIADGYKLLMADIRVLLDSATDFADACDAILEDQTGVQLPPVEQGRVRTSTVLTQLLKPGYRLDTRIHDATHRAVQSIIRESAHTTLGALLEGTPTKGSQPTYDDREGDLLAAFAVATVSIQDGVVVPELCKPVEEACAAANPLADGDILVAVDGEGSVGKSAVLTLPEGALATTDSHVSRLRLRSGCNKGDLASAISCFLNSSWGSIQSNARVTGATGQISLGRVDLCEVLLPEALVEKCTEIATGYQALLRDYVPRSHQIRRLVAAHAVEVTQILCNCSALSPPEDVSEEEYVKLLADISRA